MRLDRSFINGDSLAFKKHPQPTEYRDLLMTAFATKGRKPRDIRQFKTRGGINEE